MIRRRKKQEHENNERWLITYSDMITLLLVFFIVLYSMSEVQNIKFNAVVDSLKTAFNGQTILDNPVAPTGQDSDITPVTVPKKTDNKQNEKQLDQLYLKLSKYIKANHLENVVTLVDIPEGVQMTFKDDILFDTGSAKLKPAALPILKRLGGLLSAIPNETSVEGHTDNQPIVNSHYRSNWELSGARARSVMYFLINQDHLKPNRFRYVGYGQYKPLVKNDTPGHRQMNRRVNIIVLR